MPQGETLIASRGCVYLAGDGGPGSGFYQLDPPLRGEKDAPIILEGADGLDEDIVNPKVTLGGRKILYVFGEDFGSVAINGLALLGTSDKRGAVFRKVASYFKEHRVHKSRTPVSLSYPGDVAQKIYLTQMIVSRPDPEFHIQVFQLKGVTAEPMKA